MKYKLKTPLVMDVSRWQGNINWSQIAPQPILVICKASEGTTYLDPTLVQNWASLKSLGIRRGAYHFFHPEMDASKQFNNYTTAVSQAGGFITGDLAPVLDVEGLDTASADLRKSAPDGIKAWLDLAQAFSGQTPIIYTSHYQWSFLEIKSQPPSWTANYPLWVSWFPDKPDKNKVPATSMIPDGWTKWAIWQYAKDGRLTGLGVDVDLNILSSWFANQLDQTPPPIDTSHNYQGTVLAARGVNVRQKPTIASKIVASLPAGTKVTGTAIKVVSSGESWLQLKTPKVGWAAIVYGGTTLISVTGS